MISISDTGPGIPQENLPHIFDRFYQADDSYTKDSEGTGIGLALTKELIELHYGKIEVESEVGRGTTFWVYLPLGRSHLKSDQMVTSRQSIVDSRQSGDSEILSQVTSHISHITSQGIDNWQLAVDDMANKKPETRNLEPGIDSNMPIVLIVEDNTDLRMYISGYLDQTYHIIEAENGQQGLDLALLHIPDLIIRVHNMIEQRKKIREYFVKELGVMKKAILVSEKIKVSSMDEQFLANAKKAVEENTLT